MNDLSSQQINTLRQVAELLRVLAHPEEFKQLLSSAKETVDRLEAAIGVHTPVSDAVRFISKAKADVAAAESRLSELNKSFKETQALIQVAKDAHAAELANKNSEAAERAKQIEVDMQSLSAATAKLATDQASVTATLTALRERERAITERERSLAEKTKQIQQLVS